MDIPKIKKDSNQQILNEFEIVNFIKFNMSDNILDNYKKRLIEEVTKKNNKVNIESIIKALDLRINFKEKYNNVKDNYLELYNLFQENIDFIDECFNILFNDSISLCEDIENYLLKYLENLVEKEDHGIQNNLHDYTIFEKFLVNYNNHPNKDIYNKANSIIKKKMDLINRTDPNASDYKESNYLSRTQVLSLDPTINPGHSLTEDNPEQKYGGYIFTSIVLQSSLVLSLILSLLMLFK